MITTITMTWDELREPIKRAVNNRFRSKIEIGEMETNAEGIIAEVHFEDGPKTNKKRTPRPTKDEGSF